MMRVDKTMLAAVLLGALAAGTYASCANSCSGHGTCGSHDRCTCYSGFTGTDCSLKTCPSGPSFTDGGATYAECSGRGTCDASTGECACADGFTGHDCGRSSCPNDCSGHGTCQTTRDASGAKYAGWDGDMTRSCVCDGYYTGADCSFRKCPRGDDPLTTEIECQGVSSGTQSHEVQEITVSSDAMVSGEMTLTYTDAYGQSWTTTPIAVGGDNTYDLRMTDTSNSGSCSLTYTGATNTALQNRDGVKGHVTPFGNTRTNGKQTACVCSNSAQATEALCVAAGATWCAMCYKLTSSCDTNTATTKTACAELTPAGVWTGPGVLDSDTQTTCMAAAGVNVWVDLKATSATAATEFDATVFADTQGTAGDSSGSSDCDSATGPALQALLDSNPLVRNLIVTKSEDTEGKFTVTVGGINFNNENDGGEVGRLGLAGRTDEVFHSLGDHSQDIANALTSLPYNVIPSVTVSKVTNGVSDHAESGVVFGNQHSQTYRVTFSDAANAGDQAELQCNAVGCDDDGCAPRFSGVSHTRYLSTKTGTDPMNPTGGVTDYRTAIVATGQGSFWLRHHPLYKRQRKAFTSGTYHLHWDLGNGKVSSASWAYNADAAGIQAALQTIEGWGGVSVACAGNAGYSGVKLAVPSGSEDTSKHSHSCKVTYAVGFDDGGKVPTMTYDNIYQGITEVSSPGVHDHTKHAPDPGEGFRCRNYVCSIGDLDVATVAGKAIGRNAPADSDNGPDAETTLNAATIGVNSVAFKGDNVHGYLYMRSTHADSKIPAEGTYEIIRTVNHGSALKGVLLYIPGQEDCDTYLDCIGQSTIDSLWVYDTTPLMVMWPTFSNSIALHDTTLRITVLNSINGGTELKTGTASAIGILDTGNQGTEEYAQCCGLKDCSTSSTVCGSESGDYDYDSTGKGIGGRSTEDRRKFLNLVYGSGAAGSPHSASGRGQDTTTVAGTLSLATPCESYVLADGVTASNSVQKILAGYGGYGPYVSLAHPDSTALNPKSICDCKKRTAFNYPFTVTFDITCPGWIGYQLWSDTPESVMNPAKRQLSTSFRTTALTYRRLTPNRRLDQVLAVGDKVTVLASSANTDKTFTVKSFVHDGLWGDGQGAIWQSKSGRAGTDFAFGKKEKWLGADSTSGAFSSAASGVSESDYALTLDKSVDYGAYGDYVPFAKVYPAPTEDTLVTEIKAEGTNSTHFTRIVEDISTSVNEIATLRLYSPRQNEPDASQLQGTFQLIYDGVESAAIPVSSSANQLMDALAAMPTIAHAPVVTKYESMAGASFTSFTAGKAAGFKQAMADDAENTMAGSLFVEWQITFTGPTADAKKLTFKYVDTTGDERQTSQLTDGSGTTLSNTFVFTNALEQPLMHRIDNDIVLQYSHGSTFFDVIDDEASTLWNAGDAETTAETELETTAAVHDELAMDVVPGSTMTVATAEDIYFYFYQRLPGTASSSNHPDNQDGASALADFFKAECVNDQANDQASGVSTTADGDNSRNPTISFEYDGEFSAPVALCLSGSTTGEPALLTAMLPALQSLSGLGATDAYGGASIAGWLTTGVSAGTWTVSAATTVEASFASHFDWHAALGATTLVDSDFRPRATDMLKVTLPLGADGAKFRIHFHAGFGATATADAASSFKTFQYRARNNNGRTFTVTKAYENKVTDLYSLTRAKALSQATDRTGDTSATHTASDISTGNPEDAPAGVALVAGRYAAAGGGSLQGNIMHLLEPDFEGLISSVMTYNGPCSNSAHGVTLTPGVYYGVRIRSHPTTAPTALDAGGEPEGGELMVSVGQNGRVKDVQVTSGGGNYLPGYKFAIWDKRMSRHMRGQSDCDGTKPCFCTFQIPAAETGVAIQTAANDPFLHASVRVGAVGAPSSENQCVVIASGNVDICGTGFGASNAHGFRAALIHKHATSTKLTADGVYVDGYCNEAGNNPGVNTGVLDAVTIVGAGATDPVSEVDYPKTVKEAMAAKLLLQSADTVPGSANTLALTIQPNCANDFYWQFGMYDTVTPRFHIDPIHEGVDPAQPLQKRHFVSIMGMKHYTHIPLEPEASTPKHTGWGGQTADRRESFSDILTNTYGAGYANTPDHPTDVSVTDASDTAALVAGAAGAKLTASVIVGENGIDSILSKVQKFYNTGSTSSANAAREHGLGAIIEHPEKYAYIGRGYDELTVTPVPDLMSGKKAIITFQGPKGGCSVTEVDRGTHESAECSGRGNCDRETGTCICDAGYTLEACSEQTVLV